MITVGIDASLTRTGLASLPGRTYAIIPTQAGTPPHFRLRRIAEEVYGFVEPFASAGAVLVVLETPGFIPDEHSVESIYSIGRAQGAALAGLPALPSVRVMIVTPALVRSTLGIAQVRGEHKRLVQEYVAARGIELPRRHGGAVDDDVADAYALAIFGTMVGTEEARTALPGLRRGRSR